MDQEQSHDTAIPDASPIVPTAKRGRGRPRKGEVVIKKPRVKDGPGRPRKPAEYEIGPNGQLVLKLPKPKRPYRRVPQTPAERARAATKYIRSLHNTAQHSKIIDPRQSKMLRLLAKRLTHAHYIAFQKHISKLSGWRTGVSDKLLGTGQPWPMIMVREAWEWLMRYNYLRPEQSPMQFAQEFSINTSEITHKEIKKHDKFYTRWYASHLRRQARKNTEKR